MVILIISGQLVGRWAGRLFTLIKMLEDKIAVNNKYNRVNGKQLQEFLNKLTHSWPSRDQLRLNQEDFGPYLLKYRSWALQLPKGGRFLSQPQGDLLRTRGGCQQDQGRTYHLPLGKGSHGSLNSYWLCPVAPPCLKHQTHIRRSIIFTQGHMQRL